MNATNRLIVYLYNVFSKLKIFSVLALFGLYIALTAWGFTAHKHINKLAVYSVPKPLFLFYKQNVAYVEEHSTDPDERRNVVKAEGARHYIDLDHYVNIKNGDTIESVLPKYWNDAVEKYTEDTLKEYGIAPWHISRMLYRLTEAFKEKNEQRILQLSAEIGHYVGDIHVPLHTTKNYNGQFTNQKGIHGFWESRLPELYLKNYDLIVGKAEYINDPMINVWQAVKASHYAVDSVLLFEAELTKAFAKDQKYSFEDRGLTTIEVYSKPFSKAYHDKLNGMVERRMRASIKLTASLWYTAWVNAGQPNLVKKD